MYVYIYIKKIFLLYTEKYVPVPVNHHVYLLTTHTHTSVGMQIPSLHWLLNLAMHAVRATLRARDSVSAVRSTPASP